MRRVVRAVAFLGAAPVGGRAPLPRDLFDPRFDDLDTIGFRMFVEPLELAK